MCAPRTWRLAHNTSLGVQVLVLQKYPSCLERSSWGGSQFRSAISKDMPMRYYQLLISGIKILRYAWDIQEERPSSCPNR